MCNTGGGSAAPGVGESLFFLCHLGCYPRNASMSPDLRNLQQEMEEYFREAVGENIPVFMGFESTANLLEQLQDGETAIQVSPEEPGFINFDVITKGID